MSLKYGILGLLRYSPQSGYDLVKTFNDSLQFFWQATSSQVYREVNELEDKGWVCSQRVDNDKGPARRVYQILPQGQAAFTEWVRQFAAGKGEPVRSAFVMRLFFSGEMTPDELREFLRHHYQLNLAQLRELQTAAALAQEYGGIIDNPRELAAWKLSIAYGLHTTQGVIAWLEAELARLEGVSEQ